ncbi:hypothetical protein AAHA92_08866 [Salvia divinorum]|uniref:Pectinesterase inhibitor domain-containing protein n=1 Tax=Salvia divinorum TaxID=28513 RepID=A0ABD1HPK9_SALDI
MSYSAIIFVSLALLSQCHADTIDSLCSKSNNPTLCNQVLRADSRSQGADARGFAEIALDNSLSATQASINVAKSVSNAGNKEKIDTCIENFDDAVFNLQEAKPLLRSRDRPDISTIQTKGSAALTDVDTCSEEFGANEPARLKQATDKAYTFIQLLLIIANTF